MSFWIHCVYLSYPSGLSICNFASIHILLQNQSGICLPACSCPRPCIASAIVCLLRHPKAQIPDRWPAPACAGARRPAARPVPCPRRQVPVPVPAPVMMARRRPAAAHADTQRPLGGGEGRWRPSPVTSQGRQGPPEVKCKDMTGYTWILQDKPLDMSLDKYLDN